MPWVLASIVGTTTRARDPAGMPREKSIRGSGRGATRTVASQFTNATAIWLVASTQRTPITASTQSGSPLLYACANRLPVKIAVISTIAPKIQEQGGLARCSAQGFGTGQPQLRTALELHSTLVDQVEADMREPIVAGGFGDALAREVDRPARHLAFGQMTALRKLLDRMAVAITGGKVHRSVDAARILTKDLFDGAHGLDELTPVGRPQESETADAVADGNLIGRLLLVARLHQMLDRQTRLGESLLDPRQRQRQSRALSLQAARELRNKRSRHGRARPRHVCDHQDQALRVLRRRLYHLIGPGFRQVPVHPAGGRPRDDASEILDQRHTQHDGDRPQLAEREGSDGLVCRHEAAKAVLVYAAVAVRDGLQGEVIHTGQAGRWAIRQARQFPAVASRQVALGCADLFFDQVEVVQEPFTGRGDAAVRADRGREEIARPDQYGFVRGQPWQQLVCSAPGSQFVGGGQRLAMLLHLIGAEQLRSQRRLFVSVRTI